MDEEGGEGIGVRRNELCRLQSMHEAPCCTKSPERGRQTGALVMVREEKGGTVRVLVVIVVVATHNHVALRWRRRGGEEAEAEASELCFAEELDNQKWLLV